LKANGDLTNRYFVFGKYRSFRIEIQTQLSQGTARVAPDQMKLKGALFGYGKTDPTLLGE
jgi:hypothetical protein